MRQFIRQNRLAGKSIGLVPTMGFLHQGHISLVEASKKENDITVVSIFVNPTQFAPNEDFSRYPRDFDRDAALLLEAGADVIFTPEAGDVYVKNAQTFISVEDLSKIAEGEFRPTHFRGVATIVAILFNLVQPDKAYFGQKDAQQTVVLRRMVKDLHMPIEMVVCPIVREADGLAMSSRNIYLTPSQRKDALVLSRSLKLAQDLISNGTRDAKEVIHQMKLLYNGLQECNLDYIRIVDADTFMEASAIELEGCYFIIIACKFGTTRLIDNCFISMPNGPIFQ